MEIETTRFGLVEIDDREIIDFPGGLVGFEDCRRFTLIDDASRGGALFWLQSVDRPGLAFAICDPQMFVQDYHFVVKPQELQNLGLTDPADARILVIVNKIGRTLTANMRGPLVINRRTMQGKQLVLPDKKHNSRQVLSKLVGIRPALSTVA